MSQTRCRTNRRVNRRWQAFGLTGLVERLGRPFLMYDFIAVDHESDLSDERYANHARRWVEMEDWQRERERIIRARAQWGSRVNVN